MAQQIKVGQYVFSPGQAHKIGKGSFAEVYKGYDLLRKEIVAIKVINMQAIKANSKSLESLKREQEILKKISGSNIVQLKDIINTEKDRYLYIVTEFCNTGDLDAYIYHKRKDDPLSQEECLNFFIGFVRGYKILYDNNIIHRDIKPANMLIHDDIIKIADFGLSKVIPKNSYSMLDQTKRVGSPLYMSPQVLGDQIYTDKCDVWALGITFHEMLFRETPWDKYEPKTEDDLKRIYKAHSYKFPIEKCLILEETKLIINLLERMIKYDERDRISWPEIFEHPLVTGRKKLFTPILNLSVDQSILKKSKILDKNIEAAHAFKESLDEMEKFKEEMINEVENNKITILAPNNKEANKKIVLLQDYSAKNDKDESKKFNEISGVAKNWRDPSPAEPKIRNNKPQNKNNISKPKIVLLSSQLTVKEEALDENSTHINPQQGEYQQSAYQGEEKDSRIVKEVVLSNEELQEINTKYEQEDLKMKFNKITKHIEGALTLTDFLNKVMICIQSEASLLPDLDPILMNKLLFVISKLLYIQCSELISIKQPLSTYNQLFTGRWEDYTKTSSYKAKIKAIERSYYKSLEIFNIMLICVKEDAFHLSLEEQKKIYNEKLGFDNDFTKFFSDTMISVLKILAKKLEDPTFQYSRNFLILVDYLLKVYHFHSVFIPSNDCYFNFQRYNERLNGEKEGALCMKIRSKLVLAIKKSSICNS